MVVRYGSERVRVHMHAGVRVVFSINEVNKHNFGELNMATIPTHHHYCVNCFALHTAPGSDLKKINLMDS